jgi:hypothetical protein
MSNATYKEVAALDPSALVDVLYARDFSTQTDAAVATTLVTNLGLTSVTGLSNWIAAQLTAAGSHKGAKVVELLNGFAQMTSDAVYGAYAAAFNANVDLALSLSQTTDNAGGAFAVAGVVGGKTFALTSDLQSLTGSAGNDTFNANDSTLTTGDAINGGAGTDTLSMTLANGSAYSSAPTLTSVENVQIAELGSSTAAVNLVYSTGVTGVTSRLSGQNVTFSNLQAAASVTADGTTANKTIATFKNTLASGAADAISLAVTNGATAAFQVGAINGTDQFETLNIASNGAAKNTITGITDNAGSPANYGGVKSVVVTGAADLDITLAGAATKASYDGSAATGAQTVTWGGSTTTVKTGSANDIIDASAGSFFGATYTKTIDGGAGADTLIIAENVSNLYSADATHSITNVEKVQVNAISADASTVTAVTRTVDTSYFPGSTAYAKIGGAISGSNTGAASTVSFTGLGANAAVQASSYFTGTTSGTANSGVLQVTQKVTSGTADALTVELVSPNTSTITTTPKANALTTLTVNQGADGGNTETLNLITTNPSFVASGATTSTVGNVVTTVSAGNTTNLVISGAGGLTVGTVDLKTPTGTAQQSIDASGLTAAFTLGSYSTAGVEAQAVNVKGGSSTNKYYFLDTIGTTDTVTGGAGTDTLYVKDSSTAATLSPTTTSVENLTIYTVSGGAKTFGLANTTGLTKVTVAAVPVASTAATNAAYGTTISGINGQTVVFSTAALANSGAAADFASTTTNLRVATDVTTVTAQLSGVAGDNGFNNGTIATNAGSLTIVDATLDSTLNLYAADESVTVAGTGITGDAALTKVTITGGGSKDGTATNVSKFTLAATASAGVTAITTVDATGYSGKLDISGAGLSTGAAVTTSSGANTITTSEAQLALGAVVIDGGDGTDTVAAIALNAASYRPGLRNVETVDLTEAKLTGDVAIDLTDAASVKNIKLTALTATAASSVSTTNNAYSTTVSYVNSDSTVTLKSGTGTNTATPAVTAVNGWANASGKALTITGVTGATNLTVKNGDTLKVSTDAGNGLVVNNFTNVTIKQGASYDSTYAVVNAPDARSLTIGGQDVATSGVAYAGAITASTVTAGNLTSATLDTTEGNISFGASGLTAAKLASVTASGAGDLTFGGSSATTTLLANFDASAMTGAVSIGQGVDYTTSASIKTGAKADTIWMNIQSYGNVSVDAGSQATGTQDNLKLQGAMNMGLTVVDLSSTTDQITQANGAINGAVQKGFESVDASALTGSFGLSVTGSTGVNTIIGTANADNIVGNGGADVITGGAGADTIDITDAGTTATSRATVVLSAIASDADTITGFLAGTGASADILNIFETATSDLSGTALAYVEGTQSVLKASATGVVTTAKNIITLTSGTYSSGAAVQSALADIDAGTDAAVGNGVIVIAADSSGNVNVWFDAAVASGDSVKIATLVGTYTLSDFDATNFSMTFA